MTMRITALAGTVLAVLSLAACDDGGTDSRDAAPPAESTAAETPTGDTAAAPPVSGAPQPAPVPEGSAADDTSGGAIETAETPATDVMASDGAPALAALEGEWARTEEACGSESITLSGGAVTGPKGECLVEDSDMTDGRLTVRLACGGDREAWTIDGAQDEAVPRQITLDRGTGDRLALLRCEAMP